MAAPTCVQHSGESLCAKDSESAHHWSDMVHNRGGFHKGASRGSRGAGGPGPRRARFRRFPGFLGVLGPVRHARGILASMATRQLNMSPWRPFPTPFVAETVVLGRFRAPSGRWTGPNVAVAHMNRPYCAVVQQQQPLCGDHTLLCGFHTETGVRAGGARQSLGPRGYTHVPKIATRAAGG